ncbi:hypothetical protein H0N95_01335 [Candidatus Micrarchaeota archaeon]|nr:hypothetical protein [Candidatus Micrarchaeota archaeon]
MVMVAKGLSWNEAEKIGMSLIKRKRESNDFTPVTTPAFERELVKNGFSRELARRFGSRFEKTHFDEMLCSGEAPCSIVRQKMYRPTPTDEEREKMKRKAADQKGVERSKFVPFKKYKIND